MSAIRRISDLGTQGVKTILDGSVQTADIANNAITQAKLDATVPLSGMRNKIINGSFGLWQRGAGPITGFSGYGYGPDRWRTFSYGGANNTSISRSAFTVGNQIPGHEPQYFVRIFSMSTATVLTQPIEDVRTCAGQQVTISFWAKNNAASAQNMTVRLEQYFGTGGSPSATVQTNLSTVSVTNAWQKFIVTGNVPSISGKTLGSNNDHYLDLIFVSSTTATVFDFWGVQLEEGVQATPLEQRPVGTEMALCQRYYYTSGTVWGGGGIGGYIGNTAGQFAENFNFSLPVTMRATPTLTNAFTSIDNASLLGSTATTTAVYLRETCGNTQYPYSSFTYSFTVSAEL